MSKIYSNLNNSSAITDLTIEKKIALFQVCKADLEPSRTKTNVKIVYNEMMKTINFLINKNKQLEAKLQEATAKVEESSKKLNQLPSNIIQPNSAYSSYSNALQNKPKEHIVIIRKKDENSQIDLAKEANKKLMQLKREIEVKSIKSNKYSVIVTTKEEQQVPLIINSIEKSTTLQARKPSKKIPTILIKEIDKSLTLEEILDEIAENEKIKKDDIVVKKFIANSKYNTNRLLVNFRADDTQRIVDQLFVKVGYRCCPIEKCVNPMQCYNCFKYGHIHKDREGNTTCTGQTTCPSCSGNHQQNEECPAKNDNAKLKCVNCKENHDSRSFRCKKRISITNDLLSKCIC